MPKKLIADTPENALAIHLGVDPDEISEVGRTDHYGLTVYKCGREEYAVGTDDEADAAARRNIEDSVWAFKASFLLDVCGLPMELEEAIEAFQSDKSEDANEALTALVEKCASMDELVRQAIAADGRGHFMSSYDGEENDQGDYYIYRIN